MKNILQGTSVRLAAIDPDEMSKAGSHWQRDSELDRLLESSAAPLISVKAVKESLEKDLEKQEAATFFFSIRRLEDDLLLGDMVLDVVHWNNGDAFVGLLIGERDLWGKGLGTQAMNLLLEFAFTEVNLRRVTLTVFEYNPRAIRSYEKAGFRHEGRMRQVLSREGKRWDVLYMGILREEWLALNGSLADERIQTDL
jgi:RimJ/RimL family protein N-acetyltransferase